ncbi:MAG: tyrosine protein phosphatase [Dehalococcoidia bacterium]|uniref:protein-tyrosine phosphatase family protein n=1 Tax=Candidatus Amarobacter glycogenicus TaxID=3140699 RepID=UPI0031369151|nr:tyrosine protein phosphatase [Dehalococcoidia bacterium]
MDIWPVDGPWAGQLAVCSRPRAGWFLDDDLRNLRLAGFRVLVSALTPEEVVLAELQRVPLACEEAGLEFAHFPVGNLQVAPFERAHPHLTSWNDRLRSGDGIAVHCWANVGRGPTIAAALMVLGGIQPAEAWHRVRMARGRDCPDTGEQRSWIAQFGPEALGSAAS